MASQDRGPSFNLKLELLREGHGFSFFQVMRLLRLFGRDSTKIQDSASVETDDIRIRPKLSLAFPPADVDRIEEQDDDKGPRFLVTANFLGLYGTSSPLPTFYSEDLMEEAASDESVARDFIDLVNHRLFILFFRCWSKYRQFLEVVEENNPRYLERLFSLLGLGEETLRDDIPDAYGLIRYIGLFTQFPRSVVGLKTLLQDALGVMPVEVIPCVKRKAVIPEDQRLFLGASGNLLAVDSFLGREIEDRMGKFRILIGPLNRIDFQRFLPGGDGYEKLVSLTRLYIVEPLEYDLELIISEGQVKTVCLGAPEWSSLGLNTWIFTGDELGEATMTFYPSNL
jgi:type VI secretion system protein ImpH